MGCNFGCCRNYCSYRVKVSFRYFVLLDMVIAPSAKMLSDFCFKRRYSWGERNESKDAK